VHLSIVSALDRHDYSNAVTNVLSISPLNVEDKLYLASDPTTLDDKAISPTRMYTLCLSHCPAGFQAVTWYVGNLI
jgi:hypothetical protein